MRCAIGHEKIFAFGCQFCNEYMVVNITWCHLFQIIFEFFLELVLDHRL